MSLTATEHGLLRAILTIGVSLVSVLPLQGQTIDQERLLPPRLGRAYMGLHFWDPQSGYVFTGTEILRTADAGQSWQLLYTTLPPQRIQHVFFLNPTTAWLLTDKSGALPEFLSRTTDGFATLEGVAVDFARHDRSGTSTIGTPFFLDPGDGWAPGGSNHVAITADGGRTWTSYLVPRKLGQPLRIVMFPLAGQASGTPTATPAPLDGIAETDTGMIRTTDGGMTWEPIPDAPHGLQDLRCLGRSICMALGAVNSVFVSLDGGRTWQLGTVPVGKPPYADGRDQVYSFQLMSPTRAYIFGVDTHLPPAGQEEVAAPDGTLVTPRYPRTSFVVSYDGSGWTRTNYDNIADIGQGQFVDDQNGWAVADNNNIFRTTDGGQTWTTVQDYFRQIAAQTPAPTPFVFPTPSP